MRDCLAEIAMTIRQLSSRVVYRNPWMTVREDEIERDNGTRGIYGVVEKCDSAIVIPIEGDDVYLVEQYRYPVGMKTLEFPREAWNGTMSIRRRSRVRSCRPRPGSSRTRWNASG